MTKLACCLSSRGDTGAPRRPGARGQPAAAPKRRRWLLEPPGNQLLRSKAAVATEFRAAILFSSSSKYRLGAVSQKEICHPSIFISPKVPQVSTHSSKQRSRDPFPYFLEHVAENRPKFELPTHEGRLAGLTVVPPAGLRDRPVVVGFELRRRRGSGRPRGAASLVHDGPVPGVQGAQCLQPAAGLDRRANATPRR